MTTPAPPPLFSLAQQLTFKPPKDYVARPDWRAVKTANNGRNGFEVLAERRIAKAIKHYCSALKDVKGWITTTELADRIIARTKGKKPSLQSTRVTINRVLKQPYMQDYVDHRMLVERGTRQSQWKLKTVDSSNAVT